MPKRTTELMEGRCARVERLVQKDLARSLRTIAKEGPRALHGGSLGEAMVRTMQRNGGFLSLEDLRHNRAEWWDPVGIDYRGYRVLAAGAPTNGWNSVPTASVNARALTEWRKQLLSGQRPDYGAELTKLEEIIGKLPPEDDTKARLQQWHKALREQHAKAGKWLQYDDETLRRYKAAREDPDDAKVQQELQDYVAAIGKAKVMWSGWMKNQAATYEQLRIQAESADTPVTRDILKRWLEGFASPHTYTLQLKSSSTSTLGLGKSRRLLVYSGGTEYALGADGVHEWKVETRHDYNENDQIRFQWQPDYAIRVWLGGDWSVLRGGGRVLLLDQTFSGPLALWILARDGQAQAGGVLIKFDLKNIPGPPREMFVDPKSLLGCNSWLWTSERPLVQFRSAGTPRHR